MNVLRGFLIGLANLVPGVSGATMAVIVGVYERLIDAVANFVKLRFKREQIAFIVALGIGILAAILVGSAGMKHLLERSPAVAYAIFFGLVLGSIPKLRREISDLKLFHFAVGASLMLIFELLVHTVQLSGTYVLLTGIIAACAMILPGLSGSLVLLILGVYDDILDALVNLKLAIVLPFGIGVILGIALMAPQRCDAIIVLGGGVLKGPEGYELRPHTFKRLIEGVELAKTYNAFLIVSGGTLPGSSQQPEATIMAQLAQRFEVPNEKVLVDAESKNTYENAKNVAKIVKELNLKELVLVTSAVHMKRAKMSFEKFKVRVHPYPVDYLCDYGPVSWIDFVPTKESLEANMLALHEIVGLLWYRLKTR
ncbi:undecaprenyl phosphate translocase family protein [Pseudothermotoga hypogea]|nr:DUF368 domain-containing protein [Pseudothermotoga hypogea]